MINQIIKKKCWPKFFEDVLSGKKTFDVRIADFECSKGDVLVFEEFNPEKKEYTGRTIEKKIKYILKTKEQKFWNEKDVKERGFVAGAYLIIWKSVLYSGYYSQKYGLNTTRR